MVFFSTEGLEPRSGAWAARHGAMDVLLLLLGRFENLFGKGLAVGNQRLWQRHSNLEGTQQTLVDAHHGARVVELAAVVGRAE